MKVSVIIPCFNEHNTVENLLNNVNQENSYDKEIIVIDDFSTDGTREILQKLNSKYTKLILNESNGGKGYCIQKGIKKLFDPNEILNPGKIYN